MGGFKRSRYEEKKNVGTNIRIVLKGWKFIFIIFRKRERERSCWRKSLRFLSEGSWVKHCRSPSHTIQVAKAHFKDFAGIAEKASVLHFPYFIHGPLESVVCKCHGLAHLWEMHWRTRKMCLSSAFWKSLFTEWQFTSERLIYFTAASYSISNYFLS